MFHRLPSEQATKRSLSSIVGNANYSTNSLSLDSTCLNVALRSTCSSENYLNDSMPSVRERTLSMVSGKGSALSASDGLN